MRLLVVEDDRKVAGFLEQGFLEEGYDVVIARDGVDGLSRARAGGFDLILLDFMLPGRSGLEVVAALRAERVHTPILMLTALDDPRDVHAAFQAGANAFMTKPFRFADLLDRISALLSERRLTA